MQILKKIIFKPSNNEGNVVCIAAGGTGGHIFPALVTAQYLIDNGYEIVFVTDARFHNFSQHWQDILQNKSFTLITLDVKQVHGVFLSIFVRILEFIRAIYKCFNLLKIFKTRAVIGFGSYTSLPVILGAFLRGIPAIIHEQNTYLGLGNRISSLFVKKVLTSFPKTYGFLPFTIKKAVFTGIPVRKSILDLYYTNTNSNINYNAFFRTSERVNILVLGGSQGAGIFSDILPKMLEFLDDDLIAKLFIYHQARHVDIKKVAEEYKKHGIRYHVNSFFHDIGDLMTMSHLVISRAGAGSISELCVCGAPSLLVPYKYAKNNHQFLNAKYLYQNGACLLVDQDSFTPEKLAHIVQSLVENDNELLNLSTNIKSFAVLDAHEKIKNILLDVLNIDRSEVKNKPHKGVNTGDVGIG